MHAQAKIARKLYAHIRRHPPANAGTHTHTQPAARHSAAQHGTTQHHAAKPNTKGTAKDEPQHNVARQHLTANTGTQHSTATRSTTPQSTKQKAQHIAVPTQQSTTQRRDSNHHPMSPSSGRRRSVLNRENRMQPQEYHSPHTTCGHCIRIASKPRKICIIYMFLCAAKASNRRKPRILPHKRKHLEPQSKTVIQKALKAIKVAKKVLQKS